MAGTSDANFTGQQSDTSSGLYDFLFRRLSKTQGRWISPDPAGAAVVRLSNPQSWNRYAYVQNGPLVAVDPVGTDLAAFCSAENSFDDCGGDFGFWGGSFGDGVADFNRQYGGVPATMLEGLQQYQRGVDCAFNPGSCPNGVPRISTIPGQIWISKGCEDYSSTDEFGNSHNGFLGCDAGFFMSEAQYGKMMKTFEDVRAEGIMYVQYINTYPSATRQDFELYRDSLKYFNTTLTPCDGSDIVYAVEDFIDTYTPFDVPKEKWVNRGLKLYDYSWDCKR